MLHNPQLSGGMLYQMSSDVQGSALPGTTQSIMMSGNPQFQTLYTGSPIPNQALKSSYSPSSAACDNTAPGDVQNQNCTPQSPYPIFTSMPGTPPPGPYNTQQFGNLVLKQLYDVVDTRDQDTKSVAPAYPTATYNSTTKATTFDSAFFPGLDGSAQDGFKAAITNFASPDGIMYQSYATKDAYTNAVENQWYANATSVKQQGSRAQDWWYPLLQGTQLGSGWPAGGVTNGVNKGGQYATMVVPYPIENGVYDPKPDDLVNACSSPGWTISPAYSFLSYCTDDIVVPNADNSGTVTISCPVTSAKDKNGRAVKAPGIVCVQGSDSDAATITNNYVALGTGQDGMSHGTGSNSSDGQSRWWNQADIAPSCLDIEISGKEPQLNGNYVGQMTNLSLDRLDDGSWVVPGPPPVPGLDLPNSIPKQFLPPSSPSNYGNLYVKNVCLAQQPFESWGHYASINNQHMVTPVTTTNFVAPDQGQTSSFDVFERHWMALPLHTGNSAGGSVDNKPLSLGAYMANSDGTMVGAPLYGGVNYFYGYRGRNPELVKQIASAKTDGRTYPTGLTQMNDMSPYYNQSANLTPFQGNYGAVPGSSESEGILSTYPVWLQKDMINWN